MALKSLIADLRKEAIHERHNFAGGYLEDLLNEAANQLERRVFTRDDIAYLIDYVQEDAEGTRGTEYAFRFQSLIDKLKLLSDESE